MREWCDAVVTFLLAPTCASCGERLLHPTRGCVCDGCWRAIIASRDSRPFDIRPTSSIDTACAIGPHEGALRQVVHALKYDARRSIAVRLGALMCEAAGGLMDDVDAIVPVPLHPARRRSRGFNQASDLARHTGGPVVHALARVRNTPTQTALPAAERAANVAGAFRATRHAAALTGATIALVDDVRTTGATLEACGAALKAAGVRQVIALTAARVETPGS